MRKLRIAAGWTEAQAAAAYGCSVSHVSRVEHGARPSRALIELYEERFEGDGLLLSLYEVVDYHADQERRSGRGRNRSRVRAVQGDATAFICDTIPHGTEMSPGAPFVKTWTIRNAGSIPWRDRRLERQGPLDGPGLISSALSGRYVELPDTEPGEEVKVDVLLRAPGYDCTSIAYFKMVDADGFLCFPDEHQLGLDVLVRVARNTEGHQ